MKEKEHIVFIINPISGTGSKDIIPLLIDRHVDHDLFNVEIRLTEYAGHAKELAKECAENGVGIVVAVGGDGTVNEVACGLVNSNTALAIIPCGSGNGLARHLMLPINVKGAIEVINKNVVHDLDYGEIDGHPFFCTCGMGFDAFISKLFANAGKRGPLTYLENVLKEGMKYEPETYELTIDGNETHPYKAFLLSIANASQYGNDAYIAPQASMSDGLLDVVIMEPFDLLDAPQVCIDLMNKTLNKSSKIKCFKAKDIHIRRKEPGVIHFDGDPADAGTDIQVKLHQKGIKVVVNPLADKKRRKPNMVQSAFCELFNDINVVREEISNPTRRVKVINNYIQSKLS